MSATIEERLARYTTQLDEAASTYAQRATSTAGPATDVVPVLPDPPRRPGRRTRLVALGAAVCIVAALAFTVSVVRANRDVNVSTSSSDPTVGPVTTAPTSSTAATTSTTEPSAPSPTTMVRVVPGGSSTVQVTYQPFTATGVVDPALHVTQHLGGTCVSPASGLPNGYRCFADGGSIYDPCFAGPHGTADPLVCPSNPTGPDVVELTARSVSAYPPAGVTNPWAIELSNGQRCRLVAAAWGTGGPYSCDKTGVSQPVADCHVPVPASPWWTAGCQEELTDTSPFADTRVVKIWY